MKQARASPTYYSPSGRTESILAEAARPLGSQLRLWLIEPQH